MDSMDHLHIFCAYQNGDFPVRYVSRYQSWSVFGNVMITSPDFVAFQGDRS